MNTTFVIFANLCRLIWPYFKQETKNLFNKAFDFYARDLSPQKQQLTSGF